jgi:hypothetical protein
LITFLPYPGFVASSSQPELILVLLGAPGKGWERHAM